MPNRHGASESYRYGFNGKEKDDEVKGEGNSYDFGDRMLDPRIGRWFAPDDKENKYANISTYAYVNNSPLWYIDPNGKLIIFAPGLGYSEAEGYVNSNYVDGYTNALDAYSKSRGGSGSIRAVGSRGKDNPNINRLHDALYVMWASQRPRWFIKNDYRAMNIIKTVRENYKNVKLGEPLTLMGTSQGSVSMAQAAYAMLKNPTDFGLPEDFKIDNLILAGSPVDKNSRLYKKLEKLVEAKGGKIYYDEFQVEGDNVSGLGGVTRVQALKNGVEFGKQALQQGEMIKNGQDPTHPHIRAAEDLPNNPDSGCPTSSCEVVNQIDNINKKGGKIE